MDLTTADRNIFRFLGRAIRDNALIDAGDRIAVAVSGGKDSPDPLWLLIERMSWRKGWPEMPRGRRS